MHDWTLVEILFEWEVARATATFRRLGSGSAALVAEGVVRMDVPRKNDWGSSVSVNEVRGPMDQGAGRQLLEIEMQSGDVITIVARSFALPEPAGRLRATAMAEK